MDAEKTKNGKRRTSEVDRKGWSDRRKKKIRFGVICRGKERRRERVSESSRQ